MAQQMNGRKESVILKTEQEKLPMLSNRESQAGENEQPLRPWDYNERPNICAVRIQEGDGKEGGAEKVFEEIMAENSPNLAKDINLQIQEYQRTLNRISPEKSILSLISKNRR